MAQTEPVSEPRLRGRIEPLKALGHFARLVRDPDSEEDAWRLLQALSGDAYERLYQRFRSTPSGERILKERRRLKATLNDRARLAALPPGTLGRRYAEFMDEQGLDTGFDSSAAIDTRDDERLLVSSRVHQQHDLWHVLTGYERTVAGEAAIAMFTYAQLDNKAIWFLAWIDVVIAGPTPTNCRRLRDAYRRGCACQWLPAQDWEGLLDVPVDELRARLELPPAAV